MRPFILALLLVAPLWLQPATPKADPFAAVQFLVGDWKGEGDGQPGQSTGAATFRFELEGRVLVRHSHADYPAANGRPASHHEDLLTLFAEGGDLKALYLDNENHVIRYLVAAVPGGVAFTSESAPTPRFRLTYLRKTEALVTVRFEIAPPAAPEAFKTYLEAVTRKVK
jgi:hypothetical protein